jgi:antitoxin (DNA-binding transcriptional repressor) of toxin-antitoxin stability system
MLFSVTAAKGRLAKLIRAAEEGEVVIITRSGEPVVQMTRGRLERQTVPLGALRGRIHLKPGWDAPMTEDEFLAG